MFKIWKTALPTSARTRPILRLTLTQTGLEVGHPLANMGDGPAHAGAEGRGEAVATVYPSEERLAEGRTDAASVPPGAGSLILSAEQMRPQMQRTMWAMRRTAPDRMLKIWAMYPSEERLAEGRTDAASVVFQIPDVIGQIADVASGLIRVNINVDVASAVPKAPDVIGQVLQIMRRTAPDRMLKIWAMRQRSPAANLKSWAAF